jgi:flagellar biogenesis protein FliO
LTPEAGAFQAPSLAPTLLNIALSLVFVVALFYVAIWVYRRLRASQGVTTGTEGQGAVRVLEKAWLDAKRGLAVVEMGGEAYFLGLGEDVTLLARITGEEEVAKIRESAPRQGGLLNFQEQLERVGVHLKREQWKRSKQDLKSSSAELGEQIERIKPARKKEGQ